MNLSARPTQSCARVLCIGPAEATARLSEALSIPVTGADSFFDAIARLTFHSGPPIVEAVVVDAACLPHDADHAIAALRDASAGIRVVIWDRDAAGRSRSQALAADADGTLPADCSAAMAHRIILGKETSSTSSPNSPAAKPAMAQLPVDQRQGPTKPIHSPSPAAAHLGDSDLVEAILKIDGSMLDLALALIEQSSGLRRPRFADHPNVLTPSAVPVEHEGVVFGFLDAEAADADLAPADLAPADLAPWASWLAGWLALEQRFGRLRVMAYTDELTGAWNRRYFDEFLSTTLDEARNARRQITVMVFDIDDFKKYNDRYGHDAGDEVLRETVSLLNSVIRKGDKVCRIGGDEFVVIFSDPEGPREPGSAHPRTVGDIAQRFRAQVCDLRFPRLGLEGPGALSISAGLATFPWDGMDPVSLLRLADQRALESKRRGKNVITFGPNSAGQQLSE